MNFTDNKTVVSPDKKHVVSFGEMLEQRMGAAYYCTIYLNYTEGTSPLILHERNTGNAVWKGNNAVFFPIWVDSDKGLMQQIAFYDLKKSRISIFEKLYNFVEIKAIKGNLIEAIENPYGKSKDIVIDIKTEKIEKSVL